MLQIGQKTGVVIALLLMLMCTTTCASTQTEEGPVVQRTGPGLLTAKQAYPIAKAWARKWRPRFYLERVYAVVPGDQIESGPREIIYSFIADRAFGPFHWWDSAVITVDTYKGTVVQMHTYWGATHSQRLGPFDIESVILDSRDALRIAETLGGKAYREKHPSAHVRIEGARGLADGEMFWGVGYYRPPEIRGDELNFGIEARTGEVRGDVYLPPFLPTK